MDFGDLAYLIFLAIFAVGNILRQRSKRQQQQREEQQEQQEQQTRAEGPKRASGSPFAPVPERTQGQRQTRIPPPRPVSDDPFRRILEEMLGEEKEVAGQPQTPSPVNPPARKPAAADAWEAARNADGRRRPDNLEGQSAERSEAAESEGRRGKRPVAVTFAEGYRSGESLREYADRSRMKSREKLKPNVEFNTRRSSRPRQAIRVNLREAVIYDAILRRPYP